MLNLVASPMEQFTVKPIVPIHFGSLDLSFTNASLFMTIAVFGIIAFLTFGIQRRALVPGRVQSMVEMSYEFIANTVRSTAGEEGMKFFPLVFSLFMFVLFANLWACCPTPLR